MERQLDARAAAMLKRDVERKGVAVLLPAETAATGDRRARSGGARRRSRAARRHRRGRGRRAAKCRACRRRRAARQPRHRRRRSAGDEHPGHPRDRRMRRAPGPMLRAGRARLRPGARPGAPARRRGRPLFGSVLATNLKVSGINVFSAGEFFGAAGHEEITLVRSGSQSYKKLVIADDRLVGAVLYGDTADGLWYLDLIRSGTPIRRLRPTSHSVARWPSASPHDRPTR